LVACSLTGTLGYRQQLQRSRMVSFSFS